MPSYNITTFKQKIDDPSIHWSNTYVVFATDDSTALGAAALIGGIEADVMWDNYRVFNSTARSFLGGSSVQAALNLPGQRADGDEAVELPLFNTVRIILTPAVGRPFSKYLRLPLTEADVVGFNLTDEQVTFLTTNYVTPLLEDTPIRSVNSQEVVSGVVQKAVQNRQRSAHRRTRPGFKRGWVAV